MAGPSPRRSGFGRAGGTSPAMTKRTSGDRRLLLLLRARHDKTLVALGGDLVANLPVRPDAADIGHEDARLAGNVGAHVPGIGLRIERGPGDLVDMGDPLVLGALLSLHGIELAIAHVADDVRDPVDVLLDR